MTVVEKLLRSLQLYSYAMVYILYRILGRKMNTCFVFFWQHAYALELLFDQLHEGAKALDVGSGSGILTACFARMVRALFTILAPTEAYYMIWPCIFFTSSF